MLLPVKSLSPVVLYNCFCSWTVLDLSIFLSRFRWDKFSLKNAIVRIKELYLARSNGFKLRASLWWLTNITCGLLNSRSDGTHSLQRIHWWARDVMLNEETNSSTSWMAWGIFIFATISLVHLNWLYYYLSYSYNGWWNVIRNYLKSKLGSWMLHCNGRPIKKSLSCYLNIQHVAPQELSRSLAGQLKTAATAALFWGTAYQMVSARLCLTGEIEGWIAVCINVPVIFSLEFVVCRWAAGRLTI